MKKLLSLISVIGLTAVPTSSVIACSKSENWPNIDAKVSADGQTVSFETKLTLLETTDLGSLFKNYAIYMQDKKDKIFGVPPIITLKDQSLKNKFNKKTGNNKITTDFLVSFSTIGQLNSDKDETYKWLFCRTVIDDDGRPTIDKIITGIKFTVPKVAFLDTASISSVLNEISIKGRNIDLISDKATWNLTADSGIAIPQQETITVKSHSNSEITLLLSTALKKKAGNYHVKCHDVSFNGQVSFNLKDDNFFSTASLNWEKVGDGRGTILTIQGPGVIDIKESDITSDFKITSVNPGHVPNDLKIDLLKPPSALLPGKLPKDTRVLQLSKALLSPDTYALNFKEHSVIFEVPVAQPRMFGVISNDSHNQLTISGENLEIISSRFSSLVLSGQDNQTVVPNGEKYSLDKNSTSNKIVIDLSIALGSGNYIFTYTTEDGTEIPSSVFEITNEKPNSLDNASLDSIGFHSARHIDINCSNIPDGNYTDKIKIKVSDRDKEFSPSSANANGNILGVGISFSNQLKKGEKVTIIFQVGDGKPPLSISFVF